MASQEITIKVTGDTAAKLIDTIAQSVCRTPALLEALGQDFSIEEVSVNHATFLEALSYFCRQPSEPLTQAKPDRS